MIFYDSETCGFHGVPVLLQVAEDEGPVRLISIWTQEAYKTIKLIEYMMRQEVVGFNLTFDHFHLSKIYCMLTLLRDTLGDDSFFPDEHIDDLVDIERASRRGPCLKPKAACDLMLIAKRGEFQSTMQRKPLIIRKVPAALAELLAKELDRRVKIEDIYFAKRKRKAGETRWKIRESKGAKGFCDLALAFHPSAALKVLAKEALGESDIILHGDISVDEKFFPDEIGYAPYANATKNGWDKVIKYHIRHWAYNEQARKYATNDVLYTRGLYHYFGDPIPGDVDSNLACMVASVRWRGYSVDLDAIKNLRDRAAAKTVKVPTAPEAVKRWILPDLDPMETAILQESTGKETLIEMSKWPDHPASTKALAVLNARRAKKEIELYDKLIEAECFHASFKVTGTLSNRMAGSDDLNAQGIKGTREVRACFPLADQGYSLCGGDFDGAEVAIAAAVYDDAALTADLQSGKKIHALFATSLFPGVSYEQAVQSKGIERQDQTITVDCPCGGRDDACSICWGTGKVTHVLEDFYFAGKRGVFALIYFGTEDTLVRKLGVSRDVAERAFNRFFDKYPNVRNKRLSIIKRFSALQQPNGLGTKIVWVGADDYIESLTGFRRYFTLENRICKALFDLAQNLPPEFRKCKIEVQRRDRLQTAFGAAQSAIYAAAFNIQATNTRAAGNHEIQATNAEITKKVQGAIWEHQPSGINMWLVEPMNVHDEIMAAVHPSVVDDVKATVLAAVETFRPVVPLIKMEWKTGLATWADK